MHTDESDEGMDKTNMRGFQKVLANMKEMGKQAVRRAPCLFTFLLLAILAAFMAYVFSTNFIDGQNDEMFETFQSDSEELALGSVVAGQHKAHLGKYGLGGVIQLLLAYTEDPEFADSFSVDADAPARIAFVDNPYAREYLLPGYSLHLPDGQVHEIVDVSYEDEMAVATLAAKGSLYTEANTDSYAFTITDETGTLKSGFVIDSYESQYGLQGKIYYYIARNSPTDPAPFLRNTCCLLLAAVLVAICWAAARKYNWLLGLCFYLVFLLSPWVVCFARNMYWVAFTWFIPMLFGLLCPKNGKRWIFYGLTFAAVLVKCLCGYEYVSTILIGLILFPLADLLAEKRPADRKIRWQNVLFLGGAAVLGFMTAILIHARVAGDGDLSLGLLEVMKVAYKRTYLPSGAAEYAEIHRKSHDVSLLGTVVSYFKFPTQVIAGIDGNLFLLFGLAPVFIFLWQIRSGQEVDRRIVLLLVVSLAAPLSWHVLAKAHSVVHHHMNYVLWYFGFVQICLYVIVSFFCKLLSQKKLT